ncbi:MAG TPA: AAA-like domain-containing protein [Nostocaceae cyanobacterium]|nr:AAA-like domain-containing protein [Nostocaceae cyanobacterium]
MYLQKHQRRKRGVLLTPQGLEKLKTAKSEMENWENSGNRYTLEVLSERTGLSVDTLTKVLRCDTGVDKQTLKSCFSAFNLVLEDADFFFPDNNCEEQKGKYQLLTKQIESEFPGGQVPLDSRFYVERSPIETECYRTIEQPGCLIRIKAPRLMGKTSLITRILNHATKLGYKAVPLNFQLADKATFQDLDKFLRWFCITVGLGMELPNQTADYWEDMFGSKVNCKIYFEKYLLARTEKRLVIGLDDVEHLFLYPDLADEFFGLLRSWYEEAKNRDIWKKLGLVVTHSTEVYTTLNVNKSPFNVGLPIELPPFTEKQVKNLAKQHYLNWSDQEVKKLISLVGGQPHLIRLALYHIAHQKINLEQLLQTSTKAEGIYSAHLQGKLWNLQQHPVLATVFTQIVKSPEPVEIDLEQGFKLQSMGLVHLQGNQAVPSCKLYRQFFGDRFSANS